jgi:putative transposase
VSRLRRIELAGRYFFITTNLAKGVPPLNASERDLCLDRLAKTKSKHKFSLFAYVVMPTHAHLLLWTLDSLLPALMRNWKSASGFAIAACRRRRGAVWQGRYFDFILRRAADFGDKLEYIHNNPVEAGLVTRPEDWRWSSYGFYTKRAPAPIQPDLFDIPSDPSQPLWPRLLAMTSAPPSTWPH